MNLNLIIVILIIVIAIYLFCNTNTTEKFTIDCNKISGVCSSNLCPSGCKPKLIPGTTNCSCVSI
jgi:hypothetical protein